MFSVRNRAAGCAYQKPHPAQLGRPAFRSSPRFTLVERKTQLTKIIKLPRATARATQKAAVRRLKPIGDFVHTITFDNGKEFAAHQDIASVKGRTDPCYSKISLRFSSNSASLADVRQLVERHLPVECRPVRARAILFGSKSLILVHSPRRAAWA